MANLLEALAMPMGTAAASVLLALVALALGRRRFATGLFFFAVVWIWFWSAPATAGLALRLLREPYPLPLVEDLPTADAIVVLCGSAAPPTPKRPYALLRGTADRVRHAARLRHANKAPTIIASGRLNSHPESEACAESMRQWLIAFGVPGETIYVEGRSKNTRENAVFTAALAASLGLDSILLVTSNGHMARAHAAFAKTALRIFPAPVSEVPSGTINVLAVVPNSRALSASSGAIREWIGRLVYRLRGWT